ncbi:MAG TPA: hypothetical protein VH475_06060 [Tepidisphaeraceae bacterium]|jgi:hypothetical protein
MSAASLSRASFETLESRHLFSLVIAIDAGTSGGDLFGRNVSAIGLGLPQDGLQLPAPPFGLAGTTIPDQTEAALDLRGSYRGGAPITGVGGTRLLVDVTRQGPGTITGSLRLPHLGQSFSGTAAITFLGNRRFTFVMTSGSDYASIEGRANRDGTLTGSAVLVSNGLRRDALFAVSRRPTETVVA